MDGSKVKQEPDELGAHVSAAGGVSRAPERAAQLGAVVLQLFTKAPSQWAEPRLDEDEIAAFHAARREHGIRTVAVHDSYLINLAAPDERLYERSLAAFRAELGRCAALGAEFLVTHPGNATDGDREAGIERNARAIEQALAEVGGHTMVLLETTAGAGTALGATFEELAEIRRRVRGPLRRRVGVCMDLCHVWAAGYDIREDYDGVFRAFDAAIGLRHLRLFHLNDSVAPLGSRRDRHAHIGQGALGPEPFRRLLADERFREVPKIIETPKDGDAVASDRANLERLRGYRAG
jgi:deoxyribonuclease-4|nr:MAG: deoxyribonuclease IV [bacterium]